MILCAGLSPAWQQIFVLDALAVGEVNRAREVHNCASGKVLNVGLAAHCLGTLSTLVQNEPRKVAQVENCNLRNEKSKPETAVGVSARTLALVGGLPGAAIREEFSRLNVSARWIESQSPTRVCTTILDSATAMATELVENAGPISGNEVSQFEEAYAEEARHAEVVVLTGSLPAGVPATFYRDLLAQTSGRVVLDAQGAPLLAALERRPFVVKPNREELGNTLGRQIKTDAELHAAMRELCRRGAMWVVVTQGKDRVWIGSKDALLSALPPVVEVVNPIGSGDCLAAGIARALAGGDELPEAVLLGMAAAADNVRTLLPARIDPMQVQALKETIAGMN